MPSFRHHDFGNLYIKFEVEFPSGLDMQRLDLLESVLPPRPRLPQLSPDAMIEDYDLEDVDPRSQARARGLATDEREEDGIPQGAERMQCASQ